MEQRAIGSQQVELTSDGTLHVVLDTSVLLRWGKIGQTEGLRCDADVVKFLIELYVNTRNGVQPTALCVHCQTPLKSYCIKCLQHSSRQAGPAQSAPDRHRGDEWSTLLAARLLERNSGDIESDILTVTGSSISSDSSEIKSDDIFTAANFSKSNDGNKIRSDDIPLVTDSSKCSDSGELRLDDIFTIAGSSKSKDSREISLHDVHTVADFSKSTNISEVNTSADVHAVSGSSDKTVLTQHMRIRTGDQPLVCTVCEKAFTQHSAMCRRQQTRDLDSLAGANDTHPSLADIGHISVKTGKTSANISPGREQDTKFQTETERGSRPGEENGFENLVEMDSQVILDSQGCLDSRANLRPLGCQFREDSSDEKVQQASALCQCTAESACRACQSSKMPYKNRTKSSQNSSKHFASKVCLDVFTQPTHLKMHLKTDKHPNTKNKSCKKLTAGRKSEKHPTGNASKKKYACDVCDLKCSCPSALIRHMRTHTGDKPFVCDVCSKALMDAVSLRAHMELHQDSKSFVCEVCGAGFSRKDTLKKHMRTHTGHRPYKCPVCEACFAQGTALKRHMYTHTGERPYLCELCSKSYTTPGALTRHRQAHENARGYACHICGMAFNTAVVLRQHIRGRHSTEKPFRCDQCDFVCALKWRLTMHVAGHSDRKPFVCPVCGRTFKKAWAMRKHQGIHTLDKPYACDVCQASFDRQAHLTVHKKIHDTVP